MVNDAHPIGDTCHRKAPDSRWFDGYDGHPVLLLDDFSGASSKMSLSYTLQLLDRYPITVEVKGDSVPLLATKIFITTNNHPSTWYKWTNRRIQYAALARRVHFVVCFDEDGAFSANRNAFFGELQPGPFNDYATGACDFTVSRALFPLPTI